MQAEAPQTWTVGSLVKWATDDFQARGIESPRLDAELIVAHALAITRTQVIIDAQRPLADVELAKLRALVKRRRAREPMAYLLGQREFYGRVFKVDKRVLVPRPDTETLVDVALERTRACSMSMRLLDLCTGSGCVAITLARERPTSRVTATDVSADALEVARANAQRLGAYNVAFVEGDLYAPVAGARFDVITANAPYIATSEIATLMPDVRDFEPRLALDGGADGLDLVRRIVADAHGVLVPGGVLALEVGAGEAPAVAALLSEHGFASVDVRRDYGKIERVVSGARPR
ncbi:MAG: peptide chain release factor N(5)-glutamine methyltransferase [Myxococcales bacterium]|nr:peptide chain release factor N(5)-glutamine methyltransferase [Myxococcales bacterium]